MRFCKLEALGNDFVLIDAREIGDDNSMHTTTPGRAARIADRRHGIGCDQVLILHGDTDAVARVEIINADGTYAEQCGNGMRAIAAWIDSRGELQSPQSLDTPAGRVEIARSGESQYRADLPAPAAITPAELELPEPQLPAPAGAAHLLSMGNPHLVVEWPNPPGASTLADVVGHLQQQPAWRNRVNIGLAHVPGPGEIRLRVHERGAGATPACGSGAVAAAWALGTSRGSGPWQVHQPGGCLVIDLESVHGRVPTRVTTIGPARLVFQGNIA